uniref:Ibogamine 10-hydroxylase n=1 Tax=Tabernanthe iboga TaxID=141617 RepID=I10H_TABIB|nr:ibogamine 10-hydroxylase [Tabernanthe iboga]
MEMLIVSFFAFLIFCLISVKLSTKSKADKLKLPPGPRQLPIIGNMHQMLGGLPHCVLRDLAKKYGPLMHLKFGEVSTIVVSSPEMAKEVFQKHDILFADRPSNLIAFKISSYDFLDIFASPYSDYWRQLRKICTMELLSSKRVQSFRSIREGEVLNLIRWISVQEGSVINLSKKLFSLIFGIITRAAFGKKNRYEEQFHHLDEQMTKLASGFCIADMYPSVRLFQVMSGVKPKLENLQKQLDEILGNILEEHKEESMKQKLGGGEAKEDLIDVLLNVHKRGDFGAALSNSSIKAVICNMFSAGSDTSSSALEWAISEMIKHPTTMKKAQDEVRNVFQETGNVDETKLGELKYLQAVIKETLRVHPSAPLLAPRECREQCEINGYTIPAKARVFVNAWAIGRDPMYWNEPEKFIPERFLGSEIDYQGNHYEYVPFGGGRRVCPGMSFGLANIALPLAQLIYHFDWKLPGDLKPEELDMSEDVSALSARKNNLYIIPMVYSRSFMKKEITAEVMMDEA